MFCKNCGAELKADAKFCDKCGASVNENQPAANQGVAEKPKKLWQKAWFTWFMVFLFWPVGLFLLWKNQVGGKVLRIIVTVICALAMVGVIMQDNSTGNSPSGKTKEEKPAYVCDVSGVGKVKGGISSDVGIAIYRITEARSIDSSFSSKRAQGKFVIVSVVVSNGQKDAITVDDSNFKLIDDQNREFSYSTEGSTALQMRDGNAKGFLSKVNPGIVITLDVPFDVPTNVSGLKLKARGGFTGKDIILPLKVDLVK